MGGIFVSVSFNNQKDNKIKNHTCWVWIVHFFFIFFVYNENKQEYKLNMFVLMVNENWRKI